MLLSIALAAIMQLPPGPIDAFRANLASARVGADFDCKIWYNFNPANLKNVFNFEPGVGRPEIRAISSRGVGNTTGRANGTSSA